MKKGKSITLLSIIGLIMACLIVITFVRFPVGVKNFNSVLGSIETDYDISGGTAYELKLAEDNTQAIEDIDEVIQTLKFRLEALGYENYSVKAIRPIGQDDYSIRIEAKADTNNYGNADYTTLDADIQTVALYGELEYFGGTESDPSGDNRIFDGKDVIEEVEAMEYKGSGSVEYIVAITFTDEAYDFLSDKMQEGAYYFKVMLGDTVVSPFDGKTALTTSNFGKTVTVTTGSETASNQMALQITSGGLAYKFDSPERLGDVSSPFGENLDLYCLITIGALVVLACVALIVMYKGFGIASALSLILFILVEGLMLIAIPGIRVSIGSVIGIIVATILTIDGFIITSKRISEEFASGKTIKASVKTGFKRALYPIINCSVVSGVLALVLFFMTSGQIKNFAITLGIGTIISAICTLLIVRMFVWLMLGATTKKEAFFKLGKSEKLNKEEQL